MRKTLLAALAMTLLSGLAFSEGRDVPGDTHDVSGNQQSTMLSAPTSESQAPAAMGKDQNMQQSDIWMNKDKMEHDYPRH